MGNGFPYQTMTGKQRLFVKNLSQGKSQKDSAILAGYSPHSADTMASVLMKNVKIIKALEGVGITDKMISQNLKRHIEDGIGVKATADTSLRAIDLATRLKGYQQPEPKEQTNNQTNIYINELRTMDDETLQARLNALQAEIKGST